MYRLNAAWSKRNENDAIYQARNQKDADSLHALDRHNGKSTRILDRRASLREFRVPVYVYLNMIFCERSLSRIHLVQVLRPLFIPQSRECSDEASTSSNTFSRFFAHFEYFMATTRLRMKWRYTQNAANVKVSGLIFPSHEVVYFNKTQISDHP